MYVDDEFVCYTLEDAVRVVKIQDETSVFAGTYDLKARKHGGFYGRYTKAWTWHEGMIELVDVPQFTHILIHCGNNKKNTRGCMLLGSKPSAYGSVPFISNSRVAYKRFYNLVYPSVEKGDCTITIVDKCNPV